MDSNRRFPNALELGQNLAFLIRSSTHWDRIVGLQRSWETPVACEEKDDALNRDPDAVNTPEHCNL